MFQQGKPKAYMQELDKWTETTIIEPLHHAILRGPEEAVTIACEQVKKAIRQKVLNSYHNGQKAQAKSRQRQ